MTTRETLEAAAVALQASTPGLEHPDPSVVLTRAFQATGAPAHVRFNAFVAVRSIVLGRPQPGAVSEALKGLSSTELALLCSLAARGES